MATCTVVNVQCPNGRRQKVKLTAHMTLLQVIQEVCKKQDLDANKYNLKHQRKTLDSSLTIRFANLPNNAHLELIESADGHLRSVKKCVVALQLENGERLVHEFNSDNTLFNILMHLKSQSESLTFDESLDGVACIYANQQIRGLEKLQRTTLSMIGLNGGRGVIRIIQPTLSKPDEDNDVMEGAVAKTTEMPEAVMSQVQEKQSSEEMDVASSSTGSMSVASQVSEDDTMQCTETRDLHPPPVESVASTSDGRTATQVQAFSGVGRTLSETGPEIKKARFHSPPSSSKANEESQHIQNVESIESDVSVPEREPVAFRLGDSSSVSLDEISDDFFEVTVNDLRLMLKDLKNDRTAEKPLMTTKMRDERQQSRMHQYDRVAIRVYFPDRTVLQGFFKPKETVSAVTSFVNEHLQQRNTNFYLYTTPPRAILDKPNLTLFEAKLFPAAIIHFGSPQTQESYLHSRLLQEMADFTSANEKVGEYNRSSSSSSTHEVETGTSSESQNSVQANQSKPEDQTLSTPVQQANESRENARPNTGNAVPKWFKIGKL